MINLRQPLGGQGHNSIGLRTHGKLITSWLTANWRHTFTTEADLWRSRKPERTAKRIEAEL